jgi:hypothetical protein
MVEHNRAGRRPVVAAMRLEDDWRKHLDPVGDELAMVGQPHPPVLRNRESPRVAAGGIRGRAVRLARADSHQGCGNLTRREVAAPRAGRSLMKGDIPLARIARAAGGHLARQRLDEAVEPLALAAASARIAPKALTSMPSAAVTAVEDHM